MNIFEIETPALIIDYDTFLNNSSVMMALINNGTAKLRPHFKSHKCTEIAKFQLENGAKGLTCAKLSEAEAIIKSGIKCDILIANQIVEKPKLDRLADLSKNNDLTICVDNEKNVLDLQNAMMQKKSKIKVLIEYEIGMNRCGVSDQEEFYNIYQLFSKKRNLNALKYVS